MKGIVEKPWFNVRDLMLRWNLNCNEVLDLALDRKINFFVDIDLSPKNNTMTLMRFPINWRQWRSQHEETLQRRANYQGNQAA
ncbi:hypothetical protein [Alteromonas sp. RKMC-009]|uniref:hypothetical protein n=1 Tax=Alteromonas sp. RKMC-009 TaxID=2267264 RepID=UPI00137622D5|nr:hypothetical protein [Alteromonas sp. RKMC-009]